MNDDIGGVWRTVGGRRIFIKDGQDIASAMKESGKFSKNKKSFNEDIKRELDESVIEYYKKFHKDSEIIKVTSFNIMDNLNQLDEEWKNENLKTLSELKKEYYSSAISLGYNEQKNRPNAMGKTSPNDFDMSQLYLLNDTRNKAVHNKYVEQTIRNGYHPNVNKDDYGKMTVTHEFAHSMMTTTTSNYHKNAFKEVEKIYERYKHELSKVKNDLKKAQTDMIMNFSEEKYDIAKQIQDKYDKIRVSEYAYENVDEFFAECFVDYRLGNNTSSYSKEVEKVINKYFKKENVR